MKKNYCLTAAEMRSADLYTSEVIGIPSLVLMERAALAAADVICQDYSHARAAVIAGSGNNGADGIATGRILMDRGFTVDFFLLSEHVHEGSQLETQLHIIRQYGAGARLFSPDLLREAAPDLVIDAMFGIGLTRDLAGNALDAVHSLDEYRNQAVSGSKRSRRIYALDIPSGVSADDGRILGSAVKADVTVTFGYYKRGLLMYPGALQCGRVILADIGITDRSLLRGSAKPHASMFCYAEDRPVSFLPPRTADGNKGSFGKVLIAAGSRNMAGAALLAGQAAYQTGCGMVRILTPECNRGIVQSALPEALLTAYPEEDNSDHGTSSETKCISAMTWADTVLAGPGLGRSAQAASLVRTILNQAPDLVKGLVLDADALRIIAADPELENLLINTGEKIPVILTPHMAECADLMHLSVRELKLDTADLVQKYADSHHCVLLCKDARSIAAAPDQNMEYLNISGTDALAKAGSGDVLAGIIVSLLSQGMNAFEAACAGSYFHGAAAASHYDGDLARSLLAMDLARALTT